MEVKSIVMILKRTQYQTVEFNAENGADMPETGNELVEFAEAIKRNPRQTADQNEWETSELEIESFDVIEA